MTSKAELLEAVTLTAKLAVGYPEDFNRLWTHASGLNELSQESRRCEDELKRLKTLSNIDVVSHNDSAWRPKIDTETLRDAVRQLLLDKQAAIARRFEEAFRDFVVETGKAALKLVPDDSPKEDVSENG